MFKLMIAIILMVIFSFSTQYFQAKAMFLCKPALVMPFSYFSVILGFVLDTLVFDAKYNGLMVIGMVMASVGLFSKFVALYFEQGQQEKEKGPPGWRRNDYLNCFIDTCACFRTDLVEKESMESTLKQNKSIICDLLIL